MYMYMYMYVTLPGVHAPCVATLHNVTCTCVYMWAYIAIRQILDLPYIKDLM